MRKKFLLLPVAAMLALTSCSSDEPGINGGENPAGESRYLAVSIVTTGNGTTRAAGDQYSDGSFKYEDGQEEENAVKGLRIYFFGSKGSPIDVKNNGTNYYDVPMSEITISGGNQGETVEKKINAVLLVNAGEVMPSKLIAVVNPTSELGTGSYDLDNLRRFVNDYATFANDNNQFVMTNSAYVDGGAPVEAQIIMPENFQKDADAAKANPVTIYVERCVAKVRVKNAIPDKVSRDDGVIMFPVKDKKTKQNVTFKRTKEDNTTEEVAVYVKFYGWDITADLKYGWLLKNVRAGWRENILGTGNWNDPSNHRSYWADVCGGGTGMSTNPNQYFSYADGNSFKQTKFDGSEWKYCNENGEKNYNGTYYKNTEVIIKGELCDQDGNPLTFTEIAGTRIIDDNSFTNLKNFYLEMLRGGRAHTHYKAIKDADGNITSVKEIAADDITFMTANEANTTYGAAKSALTNGTYYVYSCLTEDAAKAEWYTSVTNTGTDENPVYTVDDKSVKVNVAEVNKHLYEMGHAKIWNSGKTYYYTTVMHTPDTYDAEGKITVEGKAGVVRNHIYDINLKNVYGFGTPVYNPEEIIIPEKPKDDDTYVAAEVMILSWRLVSSDVDLEWD